MSDGILKVKVKGKVDSEIRSQIIGVQTQIQRYNFDFGTQLGVLVLMLTEKLSSAL